VDSGLLPGTAVSSDYDPMLAKYIAHGPTRADALRALRAGLAETLLLGVTTNIAFLRSLLADPAVVAGELDTGLVERSLPDLVDDSLPTDVLVAAALERALMLEHGTDPWDMPGGWRIGEPAWTTWSIGVPGHDPVRIRLRGRADKATIAIGDDDPVSASARWSGDDLVVTHNGTTRRYGRARDGAVLWLGFEGHTWALTEIERATAVESGGAHGGPLTSPMPGTVLAVRVSQGAHVVAGTPLLVVEAMKMEHTITAQVDGVVSELFVHAGQQVALDQPLAVVTPENPEERQ
jgi:acetyl-CoA/propionyl-CoA carboxylase biotin carboxyl carrier protein